MIELNKKIPYFKILLIVLNAVIFFTLVYIVWVNSDIFTYGDKLFLSVAINASFLLNVYLSFRVLTDREKKKMMRQFEAYEGTLMPLIDEVRAVQHDFKNHLNILDGMSSLEETGAAQDVKQEIATYIRELDYGMGELDNVLQINNRVIGALLFSRSCQAKAEKVNFYQDIPPYEVKIPLKSYEYLSVLNALFDHVFACIKDQAGPKEIIFRLDQKKCQSYFEVLYNGKQLANMTKSFKGIKKIIRQYNGKILVINQEPGIAYRVEFDSI